MTMVTGARAIDHAAKLDIFRIAVVTTVTAWKHGVSLGFNDSALAINLEGEAELRCAGASESYPADDRIALAKRLLDFLGRHVTVATVGADGALTLIFENGAEAILRPDPSGYESYIIFLPDETTLVG
jgi:hypothetical protein